MDFPLQSTFGVRSAAVLQSAEAYQKHRKRINKSLKKTRRSLKIHTKDTKNYSNKEKISKISENDYENDQRYGKILLETAERDLLIIEETRILMAVHPSKSKEKFIVSKYKTALKNALHLLEIISKESNEYKRLEAIVYTALIQGSLAISRKNWKIAIHAFSVARCSLQFLYAHNEISEEGGKEIYTEIIDTYIDPALRLALGKDSNNKTADLDNAARYHSHDNTVEFIVPAVEIISAKDASFVKASDEQASLKLIKEIQWSQFSATIKSEDVARKIMDAQSMLEQVKESDIASYDPALLSWQEALQTHRQEMDRIKNEDEDEAQDRYILLTYINYNYLILRIRRDVSLLVAVQSKAAKKSASNTMVLEHSKDAVRLLEGITGTIAEVKDLPGVGNDEDLTSSLDSLESYYSAQKVMQIYNAYLISGRFTEALALVVKASETVQLSKEITTEFPGTLPTNTDLIAFKENISSALRRVHVLAQYARETSESSTKEYISDHLDKCILASPSETLKHIVPLEIDLVPVAVKPVLFDVAFNFINYDAPAQKSFDEKKSEETADKKKKGLFGLFGR
ncbi:unnamed protein product [Kuraishia capsulata CBS 1993]|uniref:Signal recognition particle subunit SRP68 n=1 Tax=Kuraishia capsulata CBS 1993 TaxID=1382522 RepID=W6MIV5_9ASCO|nr:uncharacterized protein KUCA_T00000282001 [Kuraishia capsulata CBS 1993]CDK24322.1 unnamed protein product [Kuraishia capsulata CBS 1993]